VASTDQPATRPRSVKAATTKVARAYLHALDAHDVEAAVALWEPGGRETVHGQLDTTAPDGVRTYLTGLLAAFPDVRFEELSLTAEADRCAMRSRMAATFAGTSRWNGLAANGARVDVEVVDHLVVRDGRIVANDVYVDGLTVARQIGVLPAAGSGADRAVARAFNARASAAARAVGGLEKVADGVWRLRGGFPGRPFNVFLLEEADGVTVFDGGIRAMRGAVARAGTRLGGIRRVVLSHAHPDHRGIAAGLAVPVLCHPDARTDAEGDGGAGRFAYGDLPPVVRTAYPWLMSRWDGGPVTIAGTVRDGDEIAGLRVVHLPGHAPGHIALWREEDRLALTADAFRVIDPRTGRASPPSLPHRAFTADADQARTSLRALAELDPATAWPAHLGPLTGDVRAQLERAARA
jgi:glyoxylase-like metal-dependent hydrolase (beta-lactamase superfamily II)/predicted ester cyclase